MLVTAHKPLRWGLWLVCACSDPSVILGKLPPEIPTPQLDSSVTDAGDRLAADGVTPPSAATTAAAATSESPRSNPRADLSRYKLSVEGGSTSEFCARTGIALTSVRADALPADCGSQITHNLFAYGLCACDELRVGPTSFLIDSFDSTQGAYAAGKTGGNIGVNTASLQLADDNQILGSLSVAGDGMLALAATDRRVLPCGRLYAPSLDLQTVSTLWLSSDTRTALFIRGDLKVASYSTLFINDSTPTPPRGELDVFIAGDLIVEADATLALGVAARPAATRVFIAGQINAQGNIQLAAQVYVPNATFSTAQTQDPDDYGAIYARKIHLASQRFHFDRAILDCGQTCSTKAPWRCGGCNDCPEGLSCKQGTCDPCQSDADCCELLTCSAGKCQVLVGSWP